MIRLGQYLPGDTVIHRLDARVKILSMVALSVLIFGASRMEMLLIGLLLVAVLGAAHITAVQALRALRPVALFLAVIFLVHLFFTEGRPLLSLAPLPARITQEGIVRGIYVTWQFACLVLGGALLTMTASPSDLVCAMERLLRPFSRLGIPSQDIAVMTAMALRFVPVLLEEYERIRTAQMARGADFATGGLRLRVRALSALAVPLLLSSFRRADELVLAMEARGYRRGPRTTLREPEFSGRDLAAFVVMAAFILVNIAFRVALS